MSFPADLSANALNALALDPALTTVRTLAAYDAAQTVLCRLVDLDADLAALGDVVDADPRLAECVADLLDGMFRVRATLGTDASIFERAAAKVAL